jgi:hypothetical protein
MQRSKKSELLEVSPSANFHEHSAALAAEEVFKQELVQAGPGEELHPGLPTRGL